MTDFLDGSRILITGGTGSLGTAMVAHILAHHKPQAVVIFSRDEQKQQTMRNRWPDDAGSLVRYMIGDVREPDDLHSALAGVDYVVHAAAMKIIPACEYNPLQVKRTNVDGAANLIRACLDRGVKRVIALSTDKSSAPLNLYGATKLVAEKLFIQANSYSGVSGTRFSCVRYGNVLGSRGSVIPLWRQQAAKGEPLTITDHHMTRFWITLDQAVEFVLSSLAIMHGGEIFVPKLPSMAMLDMAEAVVPGCRTVETGIRPGEKWHETMISTDEARHSVDIGDRYAILPEHPWWSNANWPTASPLPESWEYNSLTNDRWLKAEDMRRMLEE